MTSALIRSNMKIPHINGSTLFESKTAKNMRECVLEAINAGAYISGADLRWANLRGADLIDANLSWANLSGADLRWANLSDADLIGADLIGANLIDANLSDADLSWANLSGANLRWANLIDANLINADLRGADLIDADLIDANLSWANLGHRSICPPSGSFIAWKKGGNGEIIKLKIPKWARRVSPLVGRKCRAEFAIVLSIEKDGKKIDSCGCWNDSYDYQYQVGKIAKPDAYDADRRIECASGIHFFMTDQEALDWN